MTKLKKVLALLLALIMVLSVVACESNDEVNDVAKEEETEKIYKAGTYTGVGKGRNGDVKVEVVFDDTQIVSVNVINHDESPIISDTAIERIPKAVVDNQSLGIDAISTATITSDAILDAIADCVEQAGGNVEALKNVAVKKAEAQELVEKTADVVIIGAGGAGYTAAVAAAQNGASVIMIEKTAAPGGNTILAGGKMNAVDPGTQRAHTMTESQKEEVEYYINLEPKHDKMAEWQETLRQQFDEYKASGETYLFDSEEFHMIQTYVDGDYYGNTYLIESLCQNSPDTFKWMETLGLEWAPESEIVVGALWPRSHASINYKSGQGFIEIFKKNIEDEKMPVELFTEVKAEEIVMENGRAVGVKATGVDGTKYSFTANKGVVLSTGGFAANVEMREKYNTIWPYLGENIPTTNSSALTGDGIVMAEAIGANLVDMDKIQLAPIGDPVTGTPSMMIGISTNLYINKEGKRFVNESERRDVLAKAILEQPDGQMYLISSQQNSGLDADDKNNYGFTYQAAHEQGIAFKADTLEELAKMINVDPVVLQETVDQYNEIIATGNDPEFGRKVFVENSEIIEGPFYASLNSPSVHHTMGGVEVDVEARIINTKGEIIPGLYAAGEVTGGFHGGNRLGANAIADALTNGKLAGQNAALEK